MKKILLLLFFISGACALIYEILWTRFLTLILGNTSFSINTVVASFMAGLAIGSWVIGQKIKKIRNPLFYYALAEMGIGLYAVISPFLLRLLNQFILYLSQELQASSATIKSAQVVMCFLTLLLPTALMGSTFPLLIHFFSQHQNSVKKSISNLYFLNTLGGTVGCFLLSFFLIGTIGLSRSLYLTAVTNLIIGFIAIILQNQSRSKIDFPSIDEKEIFSDQRNRLSPTSENFLLVITFISGFVCIAYELIWTRSLSTFVVGSSIYAFATVLTTYLLGIAIGSFIFSKAFRNPNQTIKWLAVLQTAIGLSSIASLIWIITLREHHYFNGVVSISDSLDFKTLGKLFFVPLTILSVPTILMGICFPLNADLYCRHQNIAGNKIGTFYAINTLGTVAGSLLMGFVFFHFLGTSISSLLLSSLSISVGALIFAKHFSGKIRILGTSFCIVILIMTWGTLKGNFVQRMITKNFYGDPIERSIEGSTAIVWGSNSSDRSESDSRQIDINGQGISAVRSVDQRYMKMMSHLPILLHQNPQDALVICFGTGTTLGATTLYTQLKSVDCVDISPEVVELGDYFKKWNQNVIERLKSESHPKINIIVEDGRSYLLKATKSYDVITLEPPPPTNSGIVNLYTKEFYQICAHALDDQGYIAQWIPLVGQRMEMCQMEIKTFLTVFPNSTLWLPTPINAVIIGQKGNTPPDIKKTLASISDTAVKEDLHQIGIDDIDDLFATYFMGKEKLRAFSDSASILEDNNPELEYFMHLTQSEKDSSKQELILLESFFKQREPPENIVSLNPDYKNSSKNNVLKMLQDMQQVDWIDAYSFKSNQPPPSQQLEFYLKLYSEKPQNIWFQRRLKIADDNIEYYTSILDKTADKQQKISLEATIFAKSFMRERNYKDAQKVIERALQNDQSNHRLWQLYSLITTAINQKEINPQ
jgi:spermidine synthase